MSTTKIKRNKMLILENICFFFTRIFLPLLLIFGLPIWLFNYTIKTDSLLKIIEESDLIEYLPFLIVKYLFGLGFSISLLISISLCIFILRYFQLRNSELVFNSNGKISYHYPYLIFWIASNVLGFKKVQLAGLQIPMQFKIILRNTFPQILEDIYFEEPETHKGIKKTKMYDSENNDRVFLLVQDTYKINTPEYEDLQKGYKKVVVSSNFEKGVGVRVLNLELVKEVREQSLLLSKYFDELHLIMTTNPWNTNKIVNESFRQFGRFGFQKIYVYHLKKNRKYKAHRVL